MFSSSISLFTAFFALSLAILWQVRLKDALFTSFGLWRSMQPLEEFPYECKRLYDPLFEGCEDLWLDEDARTLYAACSGTEGRVGWNPTMGAWNISAAGGSFISALRIDELDSGGDYPVSKLRLIDYQGQLDLTGFDVERREDGKLRFWLANHRPAVDGTRRFLDARSEGQNSTVEVFELQKGELKMKHVKTVLHPAVHSPNKIAWTGEDAFVASNDRSHKAGLWRDLEFLWGGGSIAVCSSSDCRTGAASGFMMPNGLIRGHDGLIYVPSSARDDLKVLKLEPSSFKLTERARIALGMPVDNLNVDANGNVWATGIPKALKFVKALKDPSIPSPTTIFRIRKKKTTETDEFEVQKVVEDGDGRVVSGASVTVHDTKTGRLFIGGPVAPFIVVCQLTGNL